MRTIPVLLIAATAFVFVRNTAGQDSALVEQALSTRPDPTSPIGENFALPLGWTVRLDRPDDSVTIGATEESDIFFVSMTPGWHITTGPRAIFYHPASTATGSFRARAGIHLFPPGERNEGYGLLIGGRNLEADDQEYLYFLIRRTGEFLVKRRTGASTEELVPWTGHDAILPFTEATEGTTHNILEVTADEDHLKFFVNDSQVATLPRQGLPVDGVVGLRVNHVLNLHVDDLSVESAE